MENNKFITGMINELNNAKTLTENGAVAYATSSSKLVDLNFSISSLRGMSDENIQKRFMNAFYDNPHYTLKWLFFLRDVRGGCGERKSFRAIIKWLANAKPEIMVDLISLIPEYGRFDDVLVLKDTPVWDSVIKTIKHQLMLDEANMRSGKSVSLMAKWLPSVNTSSVESRALAKSIAKSIGVKERTYRKTLSALRSYIDVVEVKMSDSTSNGWKKIAYEHVPTHANLKYNNAFVRHDQLRREKYIEDVKNGKSTINAHAAFPYEVTRKYPSSNFLSAIDSVEVMWKALPDFALDSNTICVCDTSGSMTYSYSGDGKLTPHAIAESLGIYFAEHCVGPYNNKAITFSSVPRYIDFSHCSTLADKLSLYRSNSLVENTDIEKTMQLILDTAVNNKLKQKDIPNVLILSDMQFDAQVTSNCRNQSTLFEHLNARFRAQGYELPRITFWNLCGNTIGDKLTVPIQENKYGLTLVSGFSPTIASMVYSKKTNPFDILKEKLDSARYDAIEKILEKHHV